MRFVVTGCSQSGTTYVAEVLTAAGLPCGHEAVFDRWTPGYDTCPPIDKTELAGDSSYVAAPFLRQLPTSIVVVHLLRAPLDVIRSVVGRNQVARPQSWPWVRFLDHHVGILSEPDPAHRAARYWLSWNALVEPHATLTWHVADLSVADIEDLATKTGLAFDQDRAAAALADTPTDVASKARADIELDHLGPYGPLIEERAAAYHLPISHASRDMTTDDH